MTRSASLLFLFNIFFTYFSSQNMLEISSVSCFETRTRIFAFSLMHRDENENFYFQSQCKEVVEVMTRKVVEFLETNMGMVEDNLGQVGNNLEEAWGNLVEEYFSGDNVPALQVNCPNPKTFKTHLHTEDSPSRYPHHHQPHCQHHPNL